MLLSRPFCRANSSRRQNGLGGTQSTLTPFALCVFPQSCHLEEEDKEGEEEDVGQDEMSFEVRQSELVMGGQGLGIGNTEER